MTNLEQELEKIAIQELRKAGEYQGFDKIPEQLQAFQQDPVWSNLGMDSENFLRLRYVGNFYTSILRKIGDMFEKFVKTILKFTLDLEDADLDYSFDVNIDGKQQKRSLDVAIRLEKIKNLELRAKIANIFNSIDQQQITTAVIEIRSCYQIGDSKRIQADETAAKAARKAGLLPILMVFCSTSLTSPINRLKKTWYVVESKDAFDFLASISGFDLEQFLQDRSPIFKQEMNSLISKFILPDQEN